VAAWPGAVEVTVEHGVAVRIDGEAESRAWLLDRFTAMAQDIVTTWDIAQDIAANWTEGRCVSQLPECWDEKNKRLKYPGQVFREWLVAVDGNQPGIDRPNVKTTTNMLKAARIKRLAPPEYGDKPWSLYAELPADADAERVADIFTKAAAQPVGVTQRGLRLAMGTASGMKPPYWQQVLQNLMGGAHDLTPATARNIAATAMKWLEENPDAPTRR